MPKKYDTAFGKYYGSLEYGQAAELARQAGVAQKYLWALASGTRQVGIDVASRLMAADDKITMGMLRPDHFQD